VTSPTSSFRAGSVVTYRHPDPITGEILSGCAVVAKGSTDGSNIALLPLALYHLEVDPEHVQPAKVADVLPAALRPDEDQAPAEPAPAEPAS
jgi:hypothetical protein